MADVYFKCSCDKNLAVNEAEAGKTVACPECGGSVAIPKPAVRWKCACGEELSAGGEMTRRMVSCVKCGSESPVPSNLRLKKNDPVHDGNDPDTNAPVKPCPSCGEKIKETAVLCVHCGLNLKTGKKIKTVFLSPKRGLKKLALFLLVVAVAGTAWVYGSFLLTPFYAVMLNRYESMIADARFQDAGAMLESRGFAKYLDRSVPAGDKAFLRLSAVCEVCGGKEIREQAAVPRCPDCGGQGRVVVRCPHCMCGNCDGEGMCRECRGYGRRTCGACKGTGLGDTSMREVRCSRCRGAGFIKLIKGSTRCPDCAGSGKVSTPTQAMCEQCRGKQSVACSVCEKTGKCTVCGGRRRTELCGHCDNTGVAYVQLCGTCRCLWCADTGLVALHEFPVYSSWINHARGYVFYDPAGQVVISRSGQPGKYRIEHEGRLFDLDAGDADFVCISTDETSFEWIEAVVLDGK